MSEETASLTEPTSPCTLDRRALLVGGAVAGAALIGYPLAARLRQRSAAFIAADQAYDGRLATTIRDGLLACGFDPATVRRRRVLLKPNLVEPTREAPHMTTHPAMVLAAAEVFRGWDAHVLVGEGPGHVRDTEMALAHSGMADALDQADLEFANLNYEEIEWVENAGGASKLPGLYFPRPVVEADLVVSMPKMKTHHWIGVTAAMKNLYGVLPGVKYGWPKNVLHYAGIPQTVFDINASLPKTIAIVDAIECMEGDGPIMGSPKRMNLVVLGLNLPAVDATVCRLMGLDPRKVSYLSLAADRLGPLDESLIQQRGEPWRACASPFRILDQPHLQALRAGGGEPVA